MSDTHTDRLRAPRSLYSTGTVVATESTPALEINVPRVIAESDARGIFQSVIGAASTAKHTRMYAASTWRGFLRWAGNHVTTSGDTIDYVLHVTRIVRGAYGEMTVNVIDPLGIRAAVKSADRMASRRQEQPDTPPPLGPMRYLRPDIWNDSSYTLDAQKRSDIAKALVEPVAKRGLVAAGYLEVTARSITVQNTSGMDSYYRNTTAQYSVTVRDKAGTASGWAGMDHNDIDKIDVQALTARALQKCVDSANPRAIEPGRYTVVLEPQAVHDLCGIVVMNLDRYTAENSGSVFTLRAGLSKLGLKVMDERLTLSTDPIDPECAYPPFNGSGEPYKPTKWITKGILTELAYSCEYALGELGTSVPQPNPGAYRLAGSGTPASTEELIAGTKRGFLVTRFSGIEVIDPISLMAVGVTRDGLWLIENGKIVHPAKNFRFNMSPMFAFNNVEQIGTPTRVLGSSPAVVPPMRIRDFNFTSLADAV